MNVYECDQPWFEMQIEYNQQVRCCCYWQKEEDHYAFEKPFDVKSYWNSPIMQLKRRVIGSGNASGTGCEGCQYLKLSSKPRFVSIPNWANKRQRMNYEKAIEHYENRDRIVNSLPIKYYINFGLACNLDCIMCTQTPDREGINSERFHVPAEPVKGSEAKASSALFEGLTVIGNNRERDRRQVPVDLLLALKSEFTIATIISIIGGEPLAVPSSVQFIDHITGDPDYSDILLEIYTNGTLLQKSLGKLQRMQHIGIVVSLDSSVPAVYEYVRRESRWEDVERNILTFKETGLSNGLDWRVNVSGVIMKSTIATLPDFAAWCSRHDFPLHFVPMQSMTRYGLNTDSEDVFRYPALLKEIPDWEEKFERANEILLSKGWASSGLSVIHEELRQRARVLFPNLFPNTYRSVKNKLEQFGRSFGT